MRYASICSGIEAPSVAWESLGWNPVFFSEIEKFPSRVLAHHYPSVPNLGDMTLIDGAAWRGNVDVLIGGTPCQAFSVAGKRESLADDRGNLSLTFCELVHATDPLCVVWENVPGVLSVKDNAFGCFLAGLVGEESGPFVSRSGSWPVAGMVIGPKRSAAWRILDAQYFGLAQRRRRVFVVSFRTADGINPGAVLFEPESMRRHSAPSREARQTAPTIPARSTASGGLGTDFDCDGGTICVATGQAGAEIGADMAPTLNCNHEAPYVARTLLGKSNCSHAEDKETYICFDASEGGNGRGTPIVPVAYAIQERAVSENINACPQGSGVNVDVGYTLEARNKVQSVAYQCHGSNVGPMGHLRAGNGNESGGVPFVTAYRTSANSGVMRQGDKTAALNTNTDRTSQIIQNAYGVRRLTPRECERLQGFPDDYTNIPGAKDGPRYKALGNSMATKVINWLGRRIKLVLDECGVIA